MRAHFLHFSLFKLFYVLRKHEEVLCSVVFVFSFLYCLCTCAFNFGKFWTRNKPFILSGLIPFDSLFPCGCIWNPESHIFTDYTFMTCTDVILAEFISNNRLQKVLSYAKDEPIYIPYMKQQGKP